jgi:alpha-glucosidase
VDRQEGEPHSTLAVTRRFLAWRRTQPALRIGAWRRLEAAEPVLAFARGTADETLVCAFNLSGEAVSWRAPFALAATAAPVPAAATVDGAAVRLPPWGVLIARPREGES